MFVSSQDDSRVAEIDGHIPNNIITGRCSVVSGVARQVF